MKVEKETRWGRAAFPSSDSPLLSFVHLTPLGSILLNYITASEPNAQPLTVTDINNDNMSEEQARTHGSALAATKEVLRDVGIEILRRNLYSFIVTRQIKPLTKKRAARRKPRKDDWEESDNAFALSKGWLTVPQAAKRFPFTEGAIRHMIFQAEAYVRVKKRPSKANPTKKKPHIPDGFLDVIVRIPNKRRVFLDEKKFAAWMAQSQGV